jgi:hypothetical protein
MLVQHIQAKVDVKSYELVIITFFKQVRIILRNRSVKMQYTKQDAAFQTYISCLLKG